MSDEVKEVDLLLLMRRWDKAMAAMTPYAKQLVLDYLNNKHGEPK